MTDFKSSLNLIGNLFANVQILNCVLKLLNLVWFKLACVNGDRMFGKLRESDFMLF